MKNVTGKFFGNPSNTAQLTSPFSSYLMVPSNNSDGFVKYDFLLQNQCCVFSNIFSQYLSVPFFIIVYCYFVQDRCPPLLTCSFTHFYPTLSKKNQKILLWLYIPHILFFHSLQPLQTVLHLKSSGNSEVCRILLLL